ncbi:MAG TPA: family 20 glycosylhydrolase [Steroidobacteraceae bacterium]|nr:family 20 glycosylhydrolase [Steroidobacteraceae bacterium]
MTSHEVVLANVIPRPADVTPRAGEFLLHDQAEIFAKDVEAVRIAAYLGELLESTEHITLKVVQHPVAAKARAAIALRLDPTAAGGAPEGYAIEVTPSQILLTAAKPRGLFYGVVSLWQLVSAKAASGPGIAIPAMRIVDAPRLPWRGLMLDSARHFQSPEFIMRYIDWLALHKLNVFGWHLTDDQGWRLEIKRYPRLTGVGAWRVPAGRAAERDIDPATHRSRLYGGFYSEADVRRIVAHAAARYVTVVPEIDMPGHASAAIVAYPELGVVAPPPAVPADWGIYPNLFNVEESTFAFLDHVLAEVIALFPGPYVHLGGDEAVKDQWLASARIAARMRELGVKDVEALQGYFTHRMGEYLRAHGRRLVGWDEILAGGVPKDAIIVSWRGIEGAIEAAKSGRDAVLSPAPTLYFDNRQSGGPLEPPGRGKVVTLEDVYRFDPLPAALSPDRQYVLGLEANVWTEHVRTEERVAYMTWPRAAAVSEVGWSSGERLDWSDFLSRLPAEFDRYRLLGIHYADEVFQERPSVAPYARHMSQDLKTCTDHLVLNLEDDAPLEGPRAVFLIDIANPCWIFPSVDFTSRMHLTAAVGQLPFNFQIGKDREAIHFKTPHSAAGELEVRLDGCEGDPLVTLPLAPAADNDAVTVLPSVALPEVAGRHDLCFTFTQRTLDPLWAIDWVQVSR